MVQLYSWLLGDVLLGEGRGKRIPEPSEETGSGVLRKRGGGDGRRAEGPLLSALESRDRWRRTHGFGGSGALRVLFSRGSDPDACHFLSFSISKAALRAKGKFGCFSAPGRWQPWCRQCARSPDPGPCEIMSPRLAVTVQLGSSLATKSSEKGAF